MLKYAVLLGVLGVLLFPGMPYAADRLLPDQILTPGLVRVIPLETVCQTKWGLDRRLVTRAMKQTVFTEYQVQCTPYTAVNGPNVNACANLYEVDHLVPRSLGGADAVLNLWPQPWAIARKKDRLEVAAHKAVCKQELPLTFAQRGFMENWTTFYYMFFGEHVDIQGP